LFDVIWIGGIDSYRNGTFTWIDGHPWTSFSESLWAPGQPNDKGGENICIEYYVVGAAYFDPFHSTVTKDWNRLGTSLQNDDVE
jgi:hypothetical protein